MARRTLTELIYPMLLMIVACAVFTAVIVICTPANAANCRQFFYQPVAVQQVVYPAVAVSPYIYQAGRDIEADSLAAKVARLVVPQIVQQLQAGNLTQQQTAATTVMAQRCAKCHSGSTPKGGLVLDGTTALHPHQVTATIRAVRDDKMPKGGPALTPEQKGLLLEELLSLENQADRTRRPDVPPPQPQTQPPVGELK